MIKQAIAKLTLVALVVGLTACATNTRDQNTVVGAGTGAVAGGLVGSLAEGAGSGWIIAAGAVVGALIGGSIGHSADSTDQANMNVALDKNSIEVPANWTNDKTGAWYKIVPTSGVMPYKGSSYCRHYVAMVKHHHHFTKTRGIACRSSDGMWQQVRK